MTTENMKINTATSNNLGDTLDIIFRHKYQIGVFLAAVIAGTLIFLALQPDAYTSEAKLLVKRGPDSVLADPSIASGELLPLYKEWESEVNSEMEILGSRELIEELVQEMGAKTFLQTPPPDGSGLLAPIKVPLYKVKHSIEVLISNLRKRTGKSDEPNAADKAVELVEKNLDISVRKKSDIIMVSYTANSRTLAQQVVSEIINLYQKKRTSIHRTVGARQFFTDQTATILSELQQAEANIQSTKKKIGIVDLEQNRRALMDQVQELQLALLTRQAEDASLSARLDKLEEMTKGSTGNQDETVHINREELRDLQAAMRTAEANLAAVVAEETKLTEQLTTVQQDLDKLNEYEFKLLNMKREQDILESKYKRYADDLELTRINEALEENKISNISIVQKASYPLKGNPSRKAIKFLMAIFIGLLGGLCLAFASEKMDSTFRRPADIENRLDIHALMALPRMSPRSLKAFTEPHKSDEEHSIRRRRDATRINVFAQFESLRLRVLSRVSSRSHLPCFIGITSTQGNEGVSSIAVNLGAAMVSADPEKRYLYLDTNGAMHSKGLPFDVKGHLAAWEIVRGDENQVRFNEIDMKVISGTGVDEDKPPVSADQIISDLKKLKEYDYVITDISPVMTEPSHLRLATAMDSVILVIESEQVNGSSAKWVVDLLKEAKVHIIGVLLNKQRTYMPRWLAHHF